MHPLRRFYRRVLHGLDNYGLRLPQTLVKHLLRKRDASPAPAAKDDLVHPFDLAHGTDTSGVVLGEFLEGGSASGIYSTAYWGISPSSFTQALDQVGLLLDPDAWPRFTFVDLGCGKGRALLVSSGFAFKRLVGVELSPELAEVARTNARAFAAPWQKSRSIEILQADATTFEFPDTPLVIFLYHPFLAPVLRKVLRNLERSAAKNPREIYVLYANLSYAKVFAAFPFLRQVWEHSLPLSPEDAAVDRHGIVHERYTLYRHLP